MVKKVDITEKLNFEESPCLVIRGKEINVNSDAPTVLKILGLMSDNDPGMKEILQAYNLIFTEEAKKELEQIKLSFNDLIIVIQEAITVVTGEAAQGEQ